MVRILKTNSTKWVHQTFKDQRQFAWQNGFAAFSVSQSNIPKVRAYIEQQAEHHRQTSFQTELIHFLEKNQIPYDERYIWQ